MFVKASSVPKLPPDGQKRQSLITHLAFSVFGNSADAIAFLNEDNDALGGRPLDLATASQSGFAAVEQALRPVSAPAIQAE